jgi:hypothetical protein
MGLMANDADYAHIEQTYDDGSDDYSGHFEQALFMVYA